MGRKEKLVERFMKLPKDFTFEDTVALLSWFGYSVHNIIRVRHPDHGSGSKMTLPESISISIGLIRAV